MPINQFLPTNQLLSAFVFISLYFVRAPESLSPAANQ